MAEIVREQRIQSRTDALTSFLQKREGQHMAAMWEQDFLGHLVKDKSVFDVHRDVKENFPKEGAVTIFYTIHVSEGDYDELNKTAFRNALQVILGRWAERDYPKYENHQVVITFEKKPKSNV